MEEGRLHILLVEDDPMAARLVRRLLDGNDDLPCIIRVAETHADTRRLMDTDHFDLILLDLQLPDSKEQDSVNFIRETGDLFPIVVISALDEEALKLEAIKAGAQDFLVKGSLNEALLIKAMRYALERHQLQRKVNNYARELEDKQALLNEAQAMAQMGTWWLDPFKMELHFSKEALNILEFPPEKAVLPFEAWLELVYIKDRPTLKEMFRLAIEEGSVFNEDIRLKPAEEEFTNLNLRLRSNHEKKLEHKRIYGTIQDITSRKEIELALKRSEEKYYNLFEESRDAIYITTRDGRFLDFNRATLELFGYNQSEMQNLNVSKLYLNPFERVKFRREIESRGFVRDFEVRLRTRDGSQLDCLITASLWKSNTHKQTGYQGVIRDITEKRQAEELKKENEIIERSAKLKEQFLANMSHEIRTPINAISGLANLLKQTDMDDKQAGYVKGIVSSSEHLIALVNDILDFSKIEAGKIQFDFVEFNLPELLDQLMNTMSFKAGNKQIELVLNKPDGLPDMVIGDPVRLNQILINLVGNAVKFTDEGSVTLDITLLEETDEAVALLFKVTDTGIGIAEKDLKNIFGTFTQLTRNLAQKSEGTGLGLAITKQLVELQGGTIEVESELHQGSVFSVELRYRKPGKEDDEQGKKLVDADFDVQDIGQRRMLIVEDKKLNQLVAKETIMSWWSEVEIDLADNGKEALNKFRSTHYDIILMDVQMPVMDGYEATKKIRREFPSPKNEVPILAMTAYATTGEADKCIRAGMDDFITKPFVPGDLYHKITGMLSGEEQAGETISSPQPAPEPSPATQKLELGEPEALSLDYLNQLTGGNDELRWKIITLLLEETPGEMEKLDEFTLAKDWKKVRGVAHKMKSSISYLGLSKTLDTVKQLEEMAAEEHRVNQIPDMVAFIKHNVQPALEQLRKTGAAED